MRVFITKVKGHFAKVCRSRENKEQQKDQKKGFSSPEEDYVYTVSKEQNEKTHANVKLNGQNVHFLIDTGATVGIIDSNTFEKLN